ncbi:hypothetical protein P8C59_000073 [Phyllachora maydis]|uniref:Uncharacterized protein n=1 Tax=Phyllachora maydis TaxID=1825666 RepID=A0AAD9HV40_9PEZI|nr:hypothetical protein P8C59_000073 [Phyllachora maydis]
MADQAKGKDKEDSEDYSKVIEVLKQHIKSYKRVIASQSSDIKTLLLSLNTLKASVKDSVSALKNISFTLASLTNSSNATAATTRKTSYSPRFDPFSGTIDLDSPPRPPRKEPYLGPAINSATSNLDPPIDIGSKEGFKDTITSSMVKELSKKAYTIPDDSKLSGESNFKQWIQALSIVLRALGISNFLENPDICNTYSDSDQAVLLMLLRNSLSSSPRATISYLAKLTIAKIDIDPSLILNQYFKALESKFPSWVSRQKSSIRQARMLGLTASSLNIEYLIANILEESRNPAIEAYRAAHVANSSNSTPNSNSNPSKKGKNKKKGKKKASYNIKGQNYSAKSAKQASFMLGSYNLAIEEEEEESDSSSNSSQLRPINTGNSPISPAGIGSIILEVLSRKAPPTYTKLVLDNVLYLPNININIISRTREPEPLTGTRDLPCVLRELVIEGNKVVEKAISSPTLKEPNIGQRDYYDLLNLAKLTEECKLLAVLGSKTYLVYILSRRAVFKTSTVKFIEDNIVLKGAVSPDPSNLNTKKPISIEIGPSKLEPYESSSDTASNKAIYKLLLKYGYNPSTSNIIKLSKALYEREAYVLRGHGDQHLTPLTAINI